MSILVTVATGNVGRQVVHHLIPIAIGCDIQFIELSEAEAREAWRQQGFPDEAIEFFVWAFGNTPEEGYTVSPTVEQVTGRPPRRLAEWASEHVEDFR